MTTPTMTTAQRATLKTHITGNSDTNTLYVDGDLTGLAALLNATAAGPNNIAWKTNVSITKIGDKINGAELAGLTQVNVSRLQVVADYSPEGVNPSLADRRAFFDDIFSGAGGTVTRPALLALWKRTATRIEKVFATGTGSDASPATIVIEGPITTQELIGL